MFQRLVACLVNCCITGKANPWSSYQRTFLYYFGSKTTPLKEIASSLKRRLAPFDNEQLFRCGQIAVLVAIDKCRKNLASTITICFKEEIAALLDSVATENHISVDQLYYLKDEKNYESDIYLELFMDGLSPEDRDIVERVASGEKKVKIPAKLKNKLKNYLEK